MVDLTRGDSALNPGTWFVAPHARIMSVSEYHIGMPEESRRWCEALTGGVPEVDVVWCLWDAKHTDKKYRIGSSQQTALKELGKLVDGAEREILTFAQRFGPLVADFSRWCTAEPVELEDWITIDGVVLFGGSAGRGTWNLLMEEDESVVRYAEYAKHLVKEPTGKVRLFTAAPTRFYIWAAREINSIRSHQYDRRSDVFARDRLASLRLVPSYAPGESISIAPGRSLHLAGSLLDYLALAAVLELGSNDVSETTPRLCESCGALITIWDRRVKYCDPCRQASVSGAVRARRYRHSRRDYQTGA